MHYQIVVCSGTWRSKVENAIVPLLPHGQAKLGEIAQRLGVSQRTLMRLLASEQCTFSEILDALRLDLAKSYLQEEKSAYVRGSVALGLCRSQRIFSCFQTLDWQNTEAAT